MLNKKEPVHTGHALELELELSTLCLKCHICKVGACCIWPASFPAILCTSARGMVGPA